MTGMKKTSWSITPQKTCAITVTIPEPSTSSSVGLVKTESTSRCAAGEMPFPVSDPSVMVVMVATIDPIEADVRLPRNGILSARTDVVDDPIVTAIEHRDAARTADGQQVSPIAEAVVFGLVSIAFALFPDPIETTLALVLPGVAATLATVLTWGLVMSWIAYVVRLASMGRSLA